MVLGFLNTVGGFLFCSEGVFVESGEFDCGRRLCSEHLVDLGLELFEALDGEVSFIWS